MDFIVDLLLRILLTAVAYMVFPIIRLIINDGKFERKRARKIALWNSIVLGLIFCILTIAISESGTVWSAGPAVLYYWINRALLSKKSAKIDPNNSSAIATNKNPCNESTANNDFSLSSVNDEKITPANCDFYGSSFRVVSSNTPQATIETTPVHNPISTDNVTKYSKKETTTENTVKAKPTIKYCSHCGQPINPISKKCTGCGKQYFKGVSLKNFLVVALIFCLVLSLVLNIVLIVKLQKKQVNKSLSEWHNIQSSNSQNYTQKDYMPKSTCLAAGCENIPNKQNLYCSEHACAKSDCTSKKDYSSSFCSRHKCNSTGCDNGSNDWGDYCSEHACAEKNCSREKNYGYSSVYCSYHECNDIGCENRKKDHGSYCSEHECADPHCTSKKSVLSDYCLIHDD